MKSLECQPNNFLALSELEIYKQVSDMTIWTVYTKICILEEPFQKQYEDFPTPKESK